MFSSKTTKVISNLEGDVEELNERISSIFSKFDGKFDQLFHKFDELMEEEIDDITIERKSQKEEDEGKKEDIAADVKSLQEHCHDVIHIDSLSCTLSRNSKFSIIQTRVSKSDKYRVEFSFNGSSVHWDFECKKEQEAFFTKVTKELLEKFGA